ncbi:MAG: NADH-quinone oxidoreductase subunit NuoG [Coxiellaceae bacterium]|nr:NADH-quinone oxidoreductase subunit NuoG [Coxiellaceae bacterium]
MIEFELNGKKVTVPEGTTIIEAADQVGDYIPRFCYHKKLSIAANCRMCLVEVEKSGKPLPACATPITQDMKVKTKSDMALKAQRDVMEFLLINHPLDCPICDQGGECELQDLSLGFGRAKSEYREPKRAVCSQDIGPLVETEMTRCIQCTRCVRFGEEVAGLREMGIVNRGEKEEIGTYVQHFLQSEMSGNIIDLCPVGALTNKPARYAARGWELTEHATIAPNDCAGTNMFVHTRDQKVIRAVPRENENINETWMSDRDRFCVEGLSHADRVTKPLMKKNGKWYEVEWKYALDAIAHLTQHIKKEKGADKIAGIADYSATLEEYYLFQKFIRALGSNNVDHRIREKDFSDQHLRSFFPKLNDAIADIENYDALLLVDSNIRHEQPIISTRIFKASQDKLSVMSVNAVDHPSVFPVAEKIIDANIIRSLSEIAKALADLKNQKIATLEKTTPSDAAKRIAEKLLSSEKSAIFIGTKAFRHTHASTTRALVQCIAGLSNAHAGILSEGVNSAGAWIAGCVPHRGPVAETLIHTGLDAKSLLTTDPVSAYFILNAELENDAVYPVLSALSQAELVVCFSTFLTEKMREYADFILPAAPFTENEGTYVNACGEWQSFVPAVSLLDEAKPAWKVIRALANVMELPEFDHASVVDIRDYLRVKADAHQCCAVCKKELDIVLPTFDKNDIAVEWKMNQENPLVRRAKALNSKETHLQSEQ